MHGVDLIRSVKLFGFRYGFGFWFRWNFIDSVKMWYWMHLSAKPYCTEHGFFWEKEGCTAPKIYSRKEIREHWKNMVDDYY